MLQVRLDAANLNPIQREAVQLGLSETELRVYKMFPDDFENAKRVFTCESGMKHTDKKGNIIVSPTDDYGIVQLNKIHFSKARELGLDPLDISGNLTMARWLYDRYQWTPWVCAKKLGIISPAADG